MSNDMTKKKTKKPPGESVSATMIVRVKKPLKARYERIAEERSKPHQKVAVADVAREALIEFVKHIDQAA
jgi:hypothetical protein